MNEGQVEKREEEGGGRGDEKKQVVEQDGQRDVKRTESLKSKRKWMLWTGMEVSQYHSISFLKGFR